jgi:hypothetical protein
VKILRSGIEKTEEEGKSLMYENLHKNLSREEIDNLLNYIVGLR